MAIIKETVSNKVDEVVEIRESLCTVGGNVTQPLWTWIFLKNSKAELPYPPTILLMGIIQRKQKH